MIIDVLRNVLKYPNINKSLPFWSKLIRGIKTLVVPTSLSVFVFNSTSILSLSLECFSSKLSVLTKGFYDSTDSKEEGQGRLLFLSLKTPSCS